MKIIRILNYIFFDRDLTVLCQNPFNTVLRLWFFLSRGRFFPVQYLSSLAIHSDWTGSKWKENGLDGAAIFFDYHHLNVVPRVYFDCNANTKCFKLCNT